jgi:acylphosphatase
VTMRRIGFVVTGRVQGVGFRAATVGAARRCGATGFVQNRADGAVEGEAQAEPAAMASFAHWLAKGPAFARVDHVEVRDLPTVPGELTFAVRR